MQQRHRIFPRTSIDEAGYWQALGIEIPRILTKEETTKVLERTLSFSNNTGQTTVRVSSWWNGELRWARNRVTLASDRRDIRIRVERTIDGVSGYISTNQSDDISLQSAVQRAEQTAIFMRRGPRMAGPGNLPPVMAIPDAKIWSDTTFNVIAAERGELANRLTTDAEVKNMLSAGYLEMHAGAEMFTGPGPGSDYLKNGWTVMPPVYRKYSRAQCSMTVRHPQGTGSGWAGLTSYDWSAIDGFTLAEHALGKCLASLSPVAIEPGRYTAILEPQAVNSMLGLLVEVSGFSRELSEKGDGPFVLGYDQGIKMFRTKLGLQVMDKRITIRRDPLDPLLGTLSGPGDTGGVWIKNGILTGLGYERDYALQKLNENTGSGSGGLRMESGDSSLEEMIATTKRGVLVTRFSGVKVVDRPSVLGTGITRDGFWLIENGKISKAVKNMRFVESPLFILNQVEAIGVSVPVFYTPRFYNWGLDPRVVPPIKVNDFSFTALNDAI